MISPARKNSVLPNERGIALVLVLMVVALLTAMILDFDSRARLDVRAAANYRDDAAATMAAESAVQALQVFLQRLAKSNIRYDYENASTADTGLEYWNVKFPLVPREGLLVEWDVVDEQGKFDLNALWNPEDIEENPTNNGEETPAGTPKQLMEERIEIFRRLLQSVFPDLDSGRIDAMVDAVVDWRDTNSDIRDAESDYYQSLMPPYSARDGAFSSFDELNLVKGFEDPSIIDMLQPFVSAFPVTSGDYNKLKINLNDIFDEDNTGADTNSDPAALLRALDEDMSDSEVEGVLTALSQKPFFNNDLGLTTLPVKVNQFQSFAGNLTRLTKRLTARSEYFLVSATGVSGNLNDMLPDTRRTVTALFYRSLSGHTGAASGASGNSETSRAKVVWLRME